MEKDTKSEMQDFFKSSFIYAGAFFFFAAVFFAIGFRINISDSLDKGVYLFRKNTPIQQGDIVRFITSPEVSKLALERNYVTYRAFSDELPIDTAKIVEGIPGDSYVINKNGVFINDVLVPDSKPLDSDSIGRPMPVFQASGVLEEGQYIVMSQNHTYGFDSRYYGHITQDMILGVGKKVL